MISFCVYCATKNHLKWVALSSISIIRQTNQLLNFFVYVEGVFLKNNTIFEAIEKKYTLKVQYFFHAVNMDELKRNFNYNSRSWHQIIFARILMINFFPANKCIYIDTDVFGCGDVNELWKINLGKTLIAGSPDSMPDKTFIPIHMIKSLNKLLDQQSIDMKFTIDANTYLNSGVLMMNIDELRKFDFVNKAIKLWNTKRYSLPFPDQDLINVLTGYRRMVIDRKFNKPFYGNFSKCILRHYNHEKVTSPSVHRHLEDYDFYYDSLDEYNQLMTELK